MVDERIGHWHSHYRVVGAPEAAPVLAERLNRQVTPEVLQAYSEALERILDGDDTVYVIRRVDFSIDLVLGSSVDDARAAQRWGRRLAGRVVRQIADGEGVIRFKNQADYLAHFAADLIAGGVWQNWVYGPFAALRPLGRVHALCAALLAEAEILPEVLARLHHMRVLEEVLSVLDADTRAEVWARAVDPASGATQDEFDDLLELARSFFAAAATLADQLEMWASRRPSLESLGHVLAGRWQPPNWRDRQALAAALRDMLRVLVDQGYLRMPPTAALSRLGHVFEELDWLDTAWFEHTFEELLQDLSQRGLGLDESRSRRQARIGSTPRQRRLLVDLLEAIRSGGLRLDASEPASHANALRLLAALGDRNPEWVEDSLAPALISRLLAAWEVLARARHPAALMEAIRRGDLSAASLELQGTGQTQGTDQLRAVLDLGEEAVHALAALAGAGHLKAPDQEKKTRSAGAELLKSRGAQHVVASGQKIETQFAGVALLLRTILDARLPALLSNTEYPNPALAPSTRLQAVLLAVLAFWTGELDEDADTVKDDNGEIDPALRVLAGLDLEPEKTELRTFGELRAVWRGRDTEAGKQAAQSFAESWQRQLRGLGMAELDFPLTAIDLRPEEEIALLASSLLRVWTRWLRGFANSSLPYLRQNVINRPGRLVVTADQIRIEAEPRALDTALEMAGYLDPLEPVSWLGGKQVVFRFH